MTQNYEALGWELKKEGKDEKAIKAFDKGIELGQKVYFAYHGKGECLVNLGRYDEALNCFAEAIKIDENHNWAYLGAGRAYYLKGDYIPAKAYLKRSTECNNESVTAWLWLGKTLIKLQQEEEALNALQKSLTAAVKYRPDMISEINSEIQKVTAYISPLKKRIEELEKENKELKEKLSSKSSIIVSGNQGPVNVGGIQANDDAVINKSALDGGKSDEN